MGKYFTLNGLLRKRNIDKLVRIFSLNTKVYAITYLHYDDNNLIISETFLLNYYDRTCQRIGPI